MGVHIKDDGLVAGGIDDWPEGVLVDLGDLADGGGSVQARADGKGLLPPDEAHKLVLGSIPLVVGSPA